MARPQLSIGIIFRNEARCLERCLKSFQALKAAVPCEIVMADTGSTDGSYEIAAKYADILFDFPWINDFSAARNAVMDRCSGKWYLSVDADEWLSEDISELVDFLRSLKKRPERIGSVVVRNYHTENMDVKFSNDLMAIRIVRMSSRLRYVGTIHEYIPVAADQEPTIRFTKTILHHDGYVNWGGKRGQEKRKRNIELLRKEAERVPNDVRTLVHFTDSGHDEADFLDRVYQMVQAVKDKGPSWAAYGAPALRQAVLTANERNLPELQEWITMALEWFPRSFFVCLDIAYAIANRAWKEANYVECLRWCCTYRDAIADFRAGRGEMSGLLFSTLQFAAEGSENEMNDLYVKCLYRCGRRDEADEILEQIDHSAMNRDQFTAHVRDLIALYAEKPIQKLYEQISAPGYSDNCAEEQRKIFFQEAATTFSPKYREEEERAEYFFRHSYTLFAPLNGKCEIGTAAAVMQTEDAQVLEELLATVEDWDYLPIAALEHALQRNVHFPPAGKFLTLEEMDKLAGRLSRNTQLTTELVSTGAESPPEDLASLLWIRGVSIVAVQSCHWQDGDQGRALSRAFAKIVSGFVSRYYDREALRGENFRMLPGMYRAAWYCQKAFEALDSGNCGVYVQLLREGVTAYAGTKKMAAFLLDNTPEIKEMLAPPPEVQALADQVRAIMARYEPNDPAVAALKQSEAYQKVACWIEQR